MNDVLSLLWQKKVFFLLCLIVIGYDACYAAVANQVSEPQRVPVQNKTESSTKAAQESVAQKVYERFCVVCHRDGLVGAPKFRDKAQWDKRLSGRTIDDLVNSALKGKNAMPAKGTCYECTDEDIKAAVEYMLPKP